MEEEEEEEEEEQEEKINYVDGGQRVLMGLAPTTRIPFVGTNCPLLLEPTVSGGLCMLLLSLKIRRMLSSTLSILIVNVHPPGSSHSHHQPIGAYLLITRGNCWNDFNTTLR